MDSLGEPDPRSELSRKTQLDNVLNLRAASQGDKERSIRLAGARVMGGAEMEFRSVNERDEQARFNIHQPAVLLARAFK